MDDAATEANTSRPGSPVPPLPELPPAHGPTYRFTWDPTLRRSGPGSVSEATDHRGDNFVSPTGDLFPFNNASSMSLALPHDWSSSRHGFNAISTVLNNPRKRAAPPKAHSSLPPVAPAELPRVKRKDFEPYLSSVGPEWERFEKSTRLGREGAAQIEPPAASPPEQSTSALSPAPSTTEFPWSSRTTPHVLPSKTLPSLDIVPSIYFNTSFDLGDPRTFELVTEALDGDALDPASIAHSLPLLEKLSHYADIVEQHLVREISLRSSSFFAALTNLHDLQTESGECLDRIGKLRAMLKEVDERTAKRGLEMVRLESRLANMDKVGEGVKVVKDVSEMVGVASGLAHAGQWGEALGVIEELNVLWEAAGPSEKTKLAMPVVLDPPVALDQTPGVVSSLPVPLSSLHAFSSLPTHLHELTLEIATSLTNDLVSLLKADLHARTESMRSDEKTNEVLRDRLKPLLQGLVRTQGVTTALSTWRDAVMVEVRAAVKRHLPSSSDVDDDELGTAKKTLAERSVSLAKDLRGMPHDEFLNLIQAIYASLMRCMQGVQAQSQVITSILDSTPSPALSASSIEADLAETLASACELANTRASKVISVRSEQHAQLSLPEFHALFESTWQFVVACEVLCRKMIVGLRGAVVSQAKAFLGAFHGARLASSAKLVEDEQWAQIDVPPEIQRTADLLVDAAMRDPETFVLPRPQPILATPPAHNGGVEEPLSPPSTPPQGTPPGPLPVPEKTASATGAGSAKQLQVEERPYFVVSATLQVLVGLLADYIRLIVNLPLLTTDAVGRVIEFLKAFNSRTCQVVLGAGAMRSAGLKNIAAKHLALASQSLSIAISLIPYVRETFRRHLSATQAVMLVEFDKLKRDYQEHQHEIHGKLVVIMGDRLAVHCRSLQEIKWDVSPEKKGPNAYMEMLVKETVTLHKVLSKYLAAPTVELVMTQVLAAINHRLSEEYGKIELGSQEAKDRLLADARYLHDKMSVLKHVGAPSEMLETVVQERSVPGGTPVPVKKSRLSVKMAAVVAQAAGTPTTTAAAAASAPPRQMENGHGSAAAGEEAVVPPLPPLPEKGTGTGSPGREPDQGISDGDGPNDIPEE